MAYAYETCREHGKFHVRVKGSFALAGAAISTSSGAVRGTGFAASYVSTGVYRVTLEEPFTRLISATANYQGATADTAPTAVTIGDVNEANRTVDLVVWVEGAGTLAKANVAASGVLRRLNFELIVATDDMQGTGAQA